MFYKMDDFIFIPTALPQYKGFNFRLHAAATVRRKPGYILHYKITNLILPVIVISLMAACCN